MSKEFKAHTKMSKTLTSLNKKRLRFLKKKRLCLKKNKPIDKILEAIKKLNRRIEDLYVKFNKLGA